LKVKKAFGIMKSTNGRNDMAATNIYETMVVPLQDGTTVELKPANIKLLKKGTKLINTLTEATDEDEFLDKLIDLVVVLLGRQRPEWTEDRELAEDALDIETVYKVIEVFLGVKLNDPKLLETAMRVQAEQE
jgi:hypothetical protein